MLLTKRYLTDGFQVYSDLTETTSWYTSGKLIQALRRQEMLIRDTLGMNVRSYRILGLLQDNEGETMPYMVPLFLQPVDDLMIY